MSSDLLATILWLGTPAAISGLIAWLLANWAWFGDLTEKNPLAQQAIKLAIAVALALVSWATSTYVPSDTIKQFQPIWAAIFAAINAIVITGVQGAHLWWTGLVLKREAHNIDLELATAEKRARLKVLATTRKSVRGAAA